MLVRCTSKDSDNATATKSLTDLFPADRQGVFPLTLGRNYVVYAYSDVGHRRLYAIADDDFDDSDPRWYDAGLFEVVDPQIPGDWKTVRRGAWKGKGSLTTFPEWADRGESFYYWLFDGRREELAIFLQQKRICDSYYRGTDNFGDNDEE